jgi:23S rRNA maturation mini-RNase III
MPPSKRPHHAPPPTKRRPRNTENHKKPKQSSKKVYQVETILGCRLRPDTADVIPEVLVKWRLFKPAHNTWEPINNFHKNQIFEEFFNERFREHELAIYVNIANIKQKLKARIKKAMNEPKNLNLPTVDFDPFEVSSGFGVILRILHLGCGHHGNIKWSSC